MILSLLDGVASLNNILGNRRLPKVEMSLSNSSGSITFPVLPAELTISAESANEKVEILGTGEVIIPKKQKLRTVSIESYFPDKKYQQFLDNARKSKKPLNFIVTGLDVEPFSVIVDNFKPTKKSGEILDTYYVLDLVEYVPYGAKEIKKDGSGQPSTDPTIPQRQEIEKPEIPKSYSTAPEDDLFSITTRNSGSDLNWREFVDENIEEICNGGNMVLPDVNYKIPEKWSSKVPDFERLF